MFFGAGRAAAVEQTFVECGFTGECEERAAGLGFLFSLCIQRLKMVSRAEADELPFRNPGRRTRAARSWTRAARLKKLMQRANSRSFVRGVLSPVAGIQLGNEQQLAQRPVHPSP